MNYTITEKDFLIVAFAFRKYRSHLIGSHGIVFTNHTTLKHLFSNRDVKLMLVRWTLLLQEFDCEIRDRKSSKNVTVDHLSRTASDGGTKAPISECFSNYQLFAV